MSSLLVKDDLVYRRATLDDVDQLLEIENACFTTDRLSKRSFRRWIQAVHAIFLVAEREQKLIAYGLVWCHKGPRLARMYSLAVLDEERGQGIGKHLMLLLEEAAAERGHLFMRLEVAKQNQAAIDLYQSVGYRIFGEYSDYYYDHSDALRMQKVIQQIKTEKLRRLTPWYQQTTEFTCGPAALMMAMASLDKNCTMSQVLELDLWREATTIFMTSGLGGCHPFGLALAAQRRGYQSVVYVNSEKPLFIEGVRTAHKKAIMEVVHQHFLQQARAGGVEIIYQDISQQQIIDWLDQGCAVVMLVSSYHLDGKKAPHWVTVTSADEHCFYFHEPDPDEAWQQLAIDCQYLPIAKEDFDRMSTFGSGRLRTAFAIKPVQKN